MTDQKSSFRWPLVNSGNSWSLPRISMPDYFSLQWDFPLENWLIVGHAIDDEGGEYSISVYIGRVALSPDSPKAEQLAQIGIGIGIAATNDYHMYTVMGVGVSDTDVKAKLYVPPATDFAFTAVFADPPANFTYVGEALEDPPLGIAGARYELGFDLSQTTEPPMALSLSLTDALGTRMEDTSGYNSPPQQGEAGLYNNEAAQPRLRITGGTPTVGPRAVTLVGGNLWNDRQVYTYDPDNPPRPGDPMYCGTWIPLVFDSGLSAVVSTGWPVAAEKGTQWMSGRMLGIPPSGGHGNLFFGSGADRYNGGALLQALGDDWDFDVNIFDPVLPNASPHWQSPGTDRVYCTKWWIRFSPRLAQWGVPEEIFLVPLVDSCEFVQPPEAPFWEGAGRMFADRDCTRQIGHAWIEQMGYN
jgi:hypothetical protein